MASDVDPSIPLSVKPVQIDNPLDVQANAYKLKQLGIQTQQAQQDYQDSQTIRSIYQNNVDPKSGQLDMNGFSRDGYSAGLGAKVAPVIAGVLANRKTGSDIDKNEADANSANANANASTFKLAQDRAANLSNHLAALIGNPNLQRQDVIDGVNQMVGEHSLDAGARDQLINMIPQNDADLKPWLVRMGMQNQDFSKQLAARKDMAPDIQYQDAGGTRVPVNMNPLSPGYTTPAPITKTVSPDTAATNAKDLTVSANRLSANGFTPAQGDLLAAFTEHGVSIPAGMRSKEQMRSTVEGLLQRNPGKSADEIAQMVSSGEINFNSDKKAATVAAGQEGKVSTAVNELSTFGDQVLDAAAKVPRSSFVPVNQLMQMADSQISDPALLTLKLKLNALNNAYNVLSARGGTDAKSRDHVAQLFSSTTGPEGIPALVQGLKEEGAGAKAAAAQASHVGTTGTAPGAPPAAARPPITAFFGSK
jgi:hypothetical protein